MDNLSRIFFKSHNILATVRGVLASVHGVGKTDAGLSDYYIVDEIQGTYRAMMIAIAPECWSIFADFELEQFASILQDLASRVRLKSFLKHTREPKKKKDPAKYDPQHPHVSTAKLLATAKKSP
ncbi:hypothetical protein [Tolypothrix sp. NIES-4075]|uniref:hypothetical protein n=1 Tax=Tolypothrix sp. NIES-4075 TaxID=2005459 RepID=UPI00117F3F32|nr:hypothetical protein [Tolypothrix sp. NIES-4075]